MNGLADRTGGQVGHRGSPSLRTSSTAWMALVHHANFHDINSLLRIYEHNRSGGGGGSPESDLSGQNGRSRITGSVPKINHYGEAVSMI